MLRIPLDKVETIISMAHEVLGRTSDDDAGPPATGEPLPSTEDYEERAGAVLAEYLRGLGGEELADLLALAWLGRGDFTKDEWTDAQQAAEDELVDSDAAMAELIEDPLLPDDLTAGLEELGYDNPGL